MIIKCPECGHQVSDKAPVCPSCGVEIAGHIVRCENCGEIYLREEGACPNCHHTNSNAAATKDAEYDMTEKAQPTGSVVETDDIDEEPVTADGDNSADEEDVPVVTPLYEDAPQMAAPRPQNKQQKPKQSTKSSGKGSDGNKKSKGSVMFVSFVIAILICALFSYFYMDSRKDEEAKEYSTAMTTNDPTVMQQYLNTYSNAPQDHLNNVKDRLNKLKNLDEDWQNARVSNTKEGYVNYIETHPNSKHKQEALNLIDDIDWQYAQRANTEDSYSVYISQHGAGKYAKEAAERVKQMMQKEKDAATPSSTETANATSLIRKFFQAVNSKNRSGAANVLSENATVAGKSNVADFINDQFQADVKNMNWHLGDVTSIVKKPTEGSTPAFHVNMTATKAIERQDAHVEVKYNISADIANGKITQIQLNKQ